MPISQRQIARLQDRAPKLLKKLDQDQQLIEVQRKLIKLGQDARTIKLVEDLDSDPDLRVAATKNPRKVVTSRGLTIPRGFQVYFSEGSVNIHVGGSAGGHSAEAGYTTGRGFYLEVDGSEVC